jgi:hypothetical protein
MEMTLLICLIIWLVLIIIFDTLVILTATGIIPPNYPCLGELACKSFIFAAILCGFLFVIVAAILSFIEVLPSAPLCFDVSSYDYGASC